jgi:hypothetical protein
MECPQQTLLFFVVCPVADFVERRPSAEIRPFFRYILSPRFGMRIASTYSATGIAFSILRLDSLSVMAGIDESDAQARRDASTKMHPGIQVFTPRKGTLQEAFDRPSRSEPLSIRERLLPFLRLRFEIPYPAREPGARSVRTLRYQLVVRRLAGALLSGILAAPANRPKVFLAMPGYSAYDQPCLVNRLWVPTTV